MDSMSFGNNSTMGIYLNGLIIVGLLRATISLCDHRPLMIRIFAILLLLIPCIAGAADYYASPSGSGGDGSKGSPWGPTEISWTTLATGSNNTLYLFGGNWPTDAALAITHNTTGNILYIKPCSASPSPTGCDSLVNFARAGSAGNNITVTGHNVVIDGRTTASVTTPCDDGDTSSCNIKITLGDTYGIEMATAASTGNVIKWVEITGMGSTTASRYAINAPNRGTGTEISYNYFHDNDGHSDIVTYAATAALTDYGVVSVHHNIIRRGTKNYVTASRGGIDAYNNIFDVTEAATPYDVFHFYVNGENESMKYIRIYNNFFDQSDQMVFLENHCSGTCETAHVRIFNNVFTCTAPETISEVFFGGRSILIENNVAGHTVDDVLIFNNTFVNVQWGVAISGHATPIVYTNFKYVNNIFSETSSNAGYNSLSSFAMSGATWANEADAVFDHNLIYDNDTYSFQWLDDDLSEIKTYTSLATFVTDHATYDGNVNSDPKFTGAADFTLQSDSPAKDAGLDASAYTNMPTGWPFDKDGVSRTGTWDIGAYEYIAYPSASIGSGATMSIGTGATMTVH